MKCDVFIKRILKVYRPFFEKLESNATGIKNRDHQLLIDVIAHSCQLKAEVVVADERELSGRRAILNYGHTFAHAFETVFGYGKYLHGEAVSVGMLCAGRLAQKLGRVDEEFCRRQQALFSAVGLPISVKAAEPKPLLDVMRRDKKNVGNRIRFILPSEIGNVELLEEEIADAMIIESMTPYFE